jgi:hypothetical protein
MVAVEGEHIGHELVAAIHEAHPPPGMGGDRRETDGRQTKEAEC